MKLSNLHEDKDRKTARELLKLMNLVKKQARNVSDRRAAIYVQDAIHQLDNAVDVLQAAEDVY